MRVQEVQYEWRYPNLCGQPIEPVAGAGDSGESLGEPLDLLGEDLTRHAKPGAAFLLEDGELPGLIRGGLRVERYEEGWFEEGRHEARLLARRGTGLIPAAAGADALRGR